MREKEEALHTFRKILRQEVIPKEELERVIFSRAFWPVVKKYLKEKITEYNAEWLLQIVLRC